MKCLLATQPGSCLPLLRDLMEVFVFAIDTDPTFFTPIEACMTGAQSCFPSSDLHKLLLSCAHEILSFLSHKKLRSGRSTIVHSLFNSAVVALFR